MAKETKNSIRALMAIAPAFVQDFGENHEATRAIKNVIGRFGGDEGARFNRQSVMHARNGNGVLNPRDNVRRVGGAAVAPAAFTSPAKTAGLKRKLHPANPAHAVQAAASQQGEQERTELQDYELEALTLELLEQNYQPAELLGLIQESYILSPEQVEDLKQAAHLSPEDVAQLLEKQKSVDAGEVDAAAETGVSETDGFKVETPANAQAAAETAAAPEYLTEDEMRALKGKSVGAVAKEVGRIRLFATLVHLGQDVNEDWNDNQAAKQLLKLIAN